MTWATLWTAKAPASAHSNGFNTSREILTASHQFVHKVVVDSSGREPLSAADTFCPESRKSYIVVFLNPYSSITGTYSSTGREPKFGSTNAQKSRFSSMTTWPIDLVPSVGSH